MREFLGRSFFAIIVASLYSSAALSKEKVYCIGPGVCSLVAKMMGQNAIKAEFVELSLNYSDDEFKKNKTAFHSKKLIFSYPLSSLGKWTKPVFDKLMAFPNSVYLMQQAEALRHLYRIGDAPESLSSLHGRKSPYLAFYFYPFSLNRASLEIYSFLKENSDFAASKKENLSDVTKKIYDREDCLSKLSRETKTVFIFPDKVLSLFFAHLGIPVRVLNLSNLKREALELKGYNSQVFFNFDHKKNRLLKFFSQDKAKFWQHEVFPKRRMLDPVKYLGETIDEALKLVKVLPNGGC